MEPQAISSDLIRGHIDTIILHTLLDGDKFAQQISNAIEEKSDNEYKINQATLYSSLKRLENLKFVKSYWYDSVDVGGRRKYFQLTENGKSSVESNLSNWSYSRSIIDKLMDCEPTPVYKTQYIEKIVEVPVPSPSLTAEKASEPEKTNLIIEQKVETVQSQNNAEKAPDVNQDINFRNILNGLIKATAVQKVKENNVNTEIVEEKTVEEIEKPKFNQTINETDYNSQRSNNGKIDFGDLTLKAAKEGYKIKISSKDSFAPTGITLINKLNFSASLAIYLIVLFEFLIYSLVHGVTLSLSTPATVVCIALFTLFPIVMAIRYKRHPSKCIAKQITGDSILTASIIVFNLLLINLASALLFNLDFSSVYSTLIYIAIPITLYLDILVYFVIRYFISKLNSFKIKHKKTAV